MAETSRIEWTDATFNPWIGCTKVSPACDNCYASVATPTRRFGIEWGAGKPRRRTAPSNWALPLRWNAKHDEFFAEHGRRRRVFCASLADVFDTEVDPQWRIDLLELIAETPNLDWLLLTKRIGCAERLLDQALDVMSHGLTRWRDVPWPNVWIGATIANQAEANRDIPKLLRVPAAVRFLSMEPLLGPVNLTQVMRTEHGDYRGDPENPDVWTYCDNVLSGFRAHKAGGVTDPRYAVDWVIVGGESGAGARPMHPDWAYSLRDQCAEHGVPFLFKQWGEWKPAPGMIGETGEKLYSVGGVMHTSLQGGFSVARVGKKAAGRLLDGVEHTDFPGGPNA
ncbi:phage Gp37/Gp68 family protein [[Pseudomonas] boreopolis]|uniref:Protein gp37 n=1 Tax=Xanthomonas boreopolis TaxID=86183 RepID=A0A919F7J5_9XANT|nr:hypothetical protein GCM10009090_17660 [[Pseudomonas] boreopolis]